MRCTAIACTGGWVMPDVCRARGALTASAEVAHGAGRGKYPSTPLAKTMCGIIPLDHCAESSVSSSTTARSTDSGARPMDTNAASQLHMCGYSSGAAVVITPRSLPRSRYAARAASCVGAKLGSGAIASMIAVGRVTGMPTAFITGPAGGLGTALAETLAPTHTLFLGGRPSDRLDALAQRLGAPPRPPDPQEPHPHPPPGGPNRQPRCPVPNPGAPLP